MKGLTRREMTRLLVGSLALSAAPRFSRASTSAPVGRRPRKLVQIALDGGCDWLYTVDPKSAREVRAGIGPLFSADEQITVGNARFGPMWRALSKFLPHMTVINGIAVDTVAHETGQVQMRQLRRDVISMRDETALNIIGRAVSPSAPLHSLHVGPGESKALPENERLLVDTESGPLLAQLHAIANDEALRATALQALEDAARRGGAPASFRGIEHLLTSMHGTTLPVCPALGLETSGWPSWFSPDKGKRIEDREGMQFEWALYALQHDLSPTVYFSSYYWDTHTQNHAMQSAGHAHFALRLAHFLEKLATTPDRNGRPLLDDIGILITSELGRFPYVNPQEGKDHFPQVSAVLMGPGLRPGSFGQTNDETAALDVSLRTGRPAAGGAHVTLDDLGRTVLEWMGVPDPKAAGYSGRVLEYCLA